MSPGDRAAGEDAFGGGGGLMLRLALYACLALRRALAALTLGEAGEAGERGRGLMADKPVPTEDRVPVPELNRSTTSSLASPAPAQLVTRVPGFDEFALPNPLAVVDTTCVYHDARGFSTGLYTIFPFLAPKIDSLKGFPSM